MKLSSFVVLRPVCFFIVMSFIVLLLPALMIPLWVIKVHRIETEAKLITGNVQQELISGVEKTAKLLSPMNRSTGNLRKVLSSSLDKTELSFFEIETEVAPVLFQALSTIPHLSQISYIGLDGLFFSFYVKADQPLAVYSNASLPSFLNATTNYTWYTQPVNGNSGRLYGEATKTSPSLFINASWFQEALQNTNGYASVGFGWSNDQDPLVLNTVGIDNRRALSLGYPLKSLVEFLIASVSGYNGSLYLATNDGIVLGPRIPNTRMVLVGNSVSFQLLGPNGDKIGHVGNITCQPNDGTLRNSIIELWKTKYLFCCSPLEIVGVQMVYALALPYKGLESFMHQNIKFALTLLILMMLVVVLNVFTFIVLLVRAARREMHLCFALIKQMEATQQAERKSINKSLALSSASHDVRACLAGIMGLLEICHAEAAPRSDLETNLLLAEGSAKDLLGMLNSILDASKIEAGKTQLEEEEFDLEQLLEDVVDLFHTVGMKKDVDVVLDPYDGSLRKCSIVRGDRGKLKQILCNLLSNAVKFTSEGHVSVRVWAKKPSFKSEILASSQDNAIRWMSCFLFQNDRACRDLEVATNVQQDQNRMEFFFEVNDTGKGIPKEKQKSVFENYVQVKEAASGQEGTGLGLGIVQSLVRLMGGEIVIVDKELGEKGTCFRFNTFLTVCGIDSSGHRREDDLESHGGCLSSDSNLHSGPSTRVHSPVTDGSHVILLISSEERRKVIQKFMGSLRIKVSVVEQHEQLPHTLKKIKEKLILSHLGTSQKSDVPSRNDHLRLSHLLRNSSSRSKEVPLSALEGVDHTPSSRKSINGKSTSTFVLIVIDTSAGPFREISRAVAKFRKDLFNTCSTRVVWIDKPGARSINAQGLDEDKLPLMDLIISKPLHGSRLYQLIGLLPEFGDTMAVPKAREETKHYARKVSTESSSSVASTPRLQSTSRYHSNNNFRKQEGEIQEIDNLNREKPLTGKRVLVAEDNLVQRHLAKQVVSRLGADFYLCQNGDEALELICKNLGNQRKDGVLQILPFDYILMDCELPVMDGCEATKRIRQEEKAYGIHIPIIALTAHTADEANKMIEAGADCLLSKPLTQEHLMEAILYIHNN